MNLKPITKNYNYFDGNGNNYIIKIETIEYIPVKPHYSSSGVYDGGNYVKKDLNKIQYNQITSILNFAIKNKKSQIRNRVKASGLIIIQDKNKKCSYILSPDSEEKHKIENLLQGIISN